VVMLAVGLLGQAPSPAEAQVAPVAQCNDDAASNIGGQGIACTVTVTNNFLISEGGVGVQGFLASRPVTGEVALAYLADGLPSPVA